MPHISKRNLTSADFGRLYKQLVRTFHLLDTEKAKNDFLWHFLTPTEKVMLSKRLAIILLLEQGESSYKIWNLLDVSSSTVERIAQRWERGGYSKFTPKLKSNSDFVEDFIHWLNTAGGVLPPYVKSIKKRKIK